MKPRYLFLAVAAILVFSFYHVADAHARHRGGSGGGGGSRHASMWRNSSGTATNSSTPAQIVAARSAQYQTAPLAQAQAQLAAQNPTSVARQLMQQASFQNLGTNLQVSATNFANALQGAFRTGLLTTASPVVTTGEQVIRDIFGALTPNSAANLGAAVALTQSIAPNILEHDCRTGATGNLPGGYAFLGNTLRLWWGNRRGRL